MTTSTPTHCPRCKRAIDHSLLSGFDGACPSCLARFAFGDEAPADPERADLAELAHRLRGPSRGKRLGRYPVLGQLGEGGMGEVFEVLDEDLNRSVAAKVAREGASPRALEKLVFEAQVTGQLDHPNIVPVHEMGVSTDGRLYFTMKRINGATLRDMLRGSGSTGLHALLSIFLKVCDAVAYAHSRGVLHRDLKPDNIMLGAFGEVQVMDWGLARLVESDAASVSSSDKWNRTDAPSRSRDGDVVGTPAYMAPEQAAGQPDAIDQRTDVYALGGILYEMLAGVGPHESIAGVAPTPEGWLERMDGAGRGERVPLYAGLTFGRGEDAAVLLHSMRASRSHAVIERVEGQLCIRDLDSANGTNVDGRPAAPVAPLSHDGVLEIVGLRWRVVLPGGGATDRNVAPRPVKLCRQPLVPPRERTTQPVPWELEAIVFKAMAAEPEQRYVDVATLKADVAAYLEGRIVGVVRYTPGQVVFKWIGRNLAPVIAVAGVLIASLGLLALLDAIGGGQRATEQRATTAKAAAGGVRMVRQYRALEDVDTRRSAVLAFAAGHDLGRGGEEGGASAPVLAVLRRLAAIEPDETLRVRLRRLLDLVEGGARLDAEVAELVLDPR